MFALQDFTIIDGKGALGATSFANKFSVFIIDAHKKRPSLKTRPFFTNDIYCSLFNFEFVLMDFVFLQIFASAAKDKTIFRFLVLKILSAE